MIMTIVILGIMLMLSALLNIGLIWYNRNLLINLSFVSANISFLVETVIDFREHLDSVYNLETFYGDDTLSNLLRHATALTNSLKDFEDIYTLFEEEEIEEDDEFEEESFDERREAEEDHTRPAPALPSNRAKVFYGGS